jgi:hypothetical protein
MEHDIKHGEKIEQLNLEEYVGIIWEPEKYPYSYEYNLKRIQDKINEIIKQISSGE